MLVRTVDVAAAIVRRADGRVLLAERPPGRIAAGCWELPGGKIEPGETAAAAATRELAEEVGLTALALRPGPVHEYLFPTRRIRISFFHAVSWDGDARGREAQRVAWVDPAALDDRSVLPSNRRILAVLGLPALSVVAELARGADRDTFHAGIAAMLQRHGRVLLRLVLRGVAPGQRVALARRIGAVAGGWRAPVLIDGSSLEASHAGLDGVHCRRPLEPCDGRPPVGLWAVACSDSPSVRRAVAHGADIAVLDRTVPRAVADEAADLPIRIYRHGTAAEAVAAPRRASPGLSVDLADLLAAGGDGAPGDRRIGGAPRP